MIILQDLISSMYNDYKTVSKLKKMPDMYNLIDLTAELIISSIAPHIQDLKVEIQSLKDEIRILKLKDK